MANKPDIFRADAAGEEVDVDGMAEMVARLKGEEGVTVIGQLDFELGEIRRVPSPVVPGEEAHQPRRVGGGIDDGGGRGQGSGSDGSKRSIKPSFGGKINPKQMSLFAEEDGRFRCGK